MEKKDDNEYLFFFQNKSAFSQWHPSIFYSDGIKFICAEQWMMYCKAILHTNLWYTNKLIVNKADKLKIGTYGSITNEYNKNICKKILKSSGVREIKMLGRLVKGFNNTLWDQIKEYVVECGSYMKFTQNPDLKKILLDSDNKILVEASPYDKIWGIGFTADNALENKNKWGLNLLGKTLMNVRLKLRSEINSDNKDSESSDSDLDFDCRKYEK